MRDAEIPRHGNHSNFTIHLNKNLPIKHEQGKKWLEVGGRCVAFLIEKDENFNNHCCTDGVIDLEEETEDIAEREEDLLTHFDPYCLHTQQHYSKRS